RRDALLRRSRGQQRGLRPPDGALADLPAAPADGVADVRPYSSGRRKALRKARRRDRERAAAQGQVRTVGARAEEESGRGLEEAERDRVGARKAEAAGGPGAEDRRRLGEERAEAAERAAHQQRDHAEDGGDQEAPRSGSGRDAEEIHGSAGRRDEAAL